jgi:hypothetical protein
MLKPALGEPGLLRDRIFQADLNHLIGIITHFQKEKSA